VTPPGLASRLHSLPPILDNVSQTPTSSCSKGSRGLSVQPRVFGIFTETTISPDLSLRQRPSRYAIRAGRNFAFTLRFRRRRLSLHLDRSCLAKGRRLITAIDLPRTAGLRSHVRINGRSVVTGSQHTRSHSRRSLRGDGQYWTSHGITFSRHDVLEASHTRKASPLLAGYCTKSLSHRAIHLPDKEFRYLRPVHCSYSFTAEFR